MRLLSGFERLDFHHPGELRRDTENRAHPSNLLKQSELKEMVGRDEREAVGLCNTELTLVHAAVKILKESRSNVRALSLGYPDLLTTIPAMSAVVGRDIAGKVKIRPNSAQLAAGHGVPFMAQCGFLDPIDLFRELGAELHILDIVPHVGPEIVCDLNEPIPAELRASFDLIVDPGTLEHVFNIGQGLKNMCEMLRVGGVMYHQHPLSFVNHGFYNISPTFYPDFYLLNGFRIVSLKFWQEASNKQESDINVQLHDLPPFEVFDPPPRCINSVMVLKEEARELQWPMQRCYQGGYSRFSVTPGASRLAHPSDRMDALTAQKS